MSLRVFSMSVSEIENVSRSLVCENDYRVPNGSRYSFFFLLIFKKNPLELTMVELGYFVTSSEFVRWSLSLPKWARKFVSTSNYVKNFLQLP